MTHSLSRRYLILKPFTQLDLTALKPVTSIMDWKPLGHSDYETLAPGTEVWWNYMAPSIPRLIAQGVIQPL